MKIELWPIDKPKDYPGNARKWTDQAVAKVALSIKTFGFVQPVVVDKKGVIIIGHLRRAAARTIPLTEIPVHVASKLTPAQVRQLRLMDNRSHQEATWDEGLLTAEMLDLKALDLDLSLTGFSSRELDAMLRTENPAEDDVPPVPVAPVSRLGDLWLLGEHRVLCGDSLDPDSVGRLLGGNKANMVFTDPPYGIGYLPDSKLKELGKLENDHRDGRWHNFEQFAAFMDAAMGAMLDACHPGACFYVCMGWEHLNCVLKGVASRGSRAYSVIVWDRMTPRMTSFPQDYIPVNEFIVYGWKNGKNRVRQSNGEQQTTIWRFKTEKGKEMVHTTQKPVAVVSNGIMNSSHSGALVLDLFGGSGTTLISCEVTGRKCAAMELDTKYVDVIVTRWQNLTGKQATLEGHDGLTFEHVRDGRRLEAQDALKEEAVTHASGKTKGNRKAG